MTSVSYPGVYVEEIPGGARPIESAGTSTAAFVGEAERGPDDEALRITSWDGFERYYGSFIDGSYLAESVYQFFNNGGRQCYIVRLTRSDADTADVTVKNRASTAVDFAVKFSARNKGEWGNYLYLTIEDGSNDAGNTFKVTVRKQELATTIPKGPEVPEPVEVFDDLSMDPDLPNFCEKVIKRDSVLIDIDALDGNNSAQPGFHRGSVVAMVDADVPAITGRKFDINIDDDGWQKVVLPNATLADLNSLSGAITTAVTGLTKQRARTDATAFSEFACTLETPSDGNVRFVLTSGSNGTIDDIDDPGATKRSSVLIRAAASEDITGELGIGEANDGVSYGALAVRRPVNIKALQIGDHMVDGDVTATTPGTDGTVALTPTSYDDAFHVLDDKNDFSLLAAPGVGIPDIVDSGMSYCEGRPLRDVFYIGETGKYDDPDDAAVFRKNLTKANSYSALYYPWVRANDPSGKSAVPIMLPPSGYVAGLYARIDTTRGVWKAPAGTEASLNGVVGLTYNLTDTDQGSLNPINVNCIRRFDLSGIVAWGARTITSDPEWKYVPVRRAAIMLRKSIYDGIQWAVFEPNNEGLWSSLRLNIGSFMNGLFRSGAFQGGKASDAYFVRCGLGDTMTQGDIDRGQVIVLVGFAPLKPAEFVIVRIQQKAGQQ